MNRLADAETAYMFLYGGSDSPFLLMFLSQSTLSATTTVIITTAEPICKVIL